MRYVNGFLCALMIAFALVQYNDPDGVFWAIIYAIPAAWAGLAAVRPAALQDRRATAGLGICLVAAVVGTAYMWPKDTGWWRQDVWWESELAREGMGLMLVTLVLVSVAYTRWRGARDHRRAI